MTKPFDIDPVYAHYPYSKFDFLYLRDGPWPQLMPDRPMGDIPEVVKVPAAEQREFRRYVKTVYLKRLWLNSIRGLFYVFSHDRYQAFDDERFARQLTEGVYSKFLAPWPENPAADQGIGAELAAKVAASSGTGALYYVDFSLMTILEDYCLPGNYVAPSTVVFRETDKYRFEPVALRINDLVLGPENGNAWVLAKYFALQAAEYSIKFVYHIGLHFPFDTVNALTKSILPKEHIVFQLLEPHLLLSLPVNNAVLESPNSVVTDDPNKTPFYAPFATKSADVRRLLFLASDGIGGHAAYPTYDFFKIRPLNRRSGADTPERLRTRRVPSRFGEVMDRYWTPYETFVRGVVDHYVERIEKLNEAYARGEASPAETRREIKEIDLDKLATWATQIAVYIPHFPTAAELISGGPGTYAIDGALLTEALTTIIWTVSIAHAMDHVDDGRIMPDEKPYRLRVPPPESADIAPVSPQSLVARWDFFSTLLILTTFSRPITTRSMLDVKYAFKPSSGLPKLAQDFHENLLKTAAEIRADRTLDRPDATGPRQWIELEDAACSVQY
jgi:hypothetical protein